MGLWVPKLRAEYIIEGALYQEALDYARRSRAYTSDRHDFHSGGLDNKQQKMLEGKLGEKAFKLFLQDKASGFEEDHSSYENGTSMTSCSRARAAPAGGCQDPHRGIPYPYAGTGGTDHLPSQGAVCFRPALPGAECGPAAGVVHPEDLLTQGKIENQGYLDNYVMYDGSCARWNHWPGAAAGTSRYKTDCGKKDRPARTVFSYSPERGGR